MKRLVLIAIILLSKITAIDDKSASSIIEKTERKFRSVEDYQVNMVIAIDIPAFRMPKKKYTVFFKQPDQIKIKSRGFGLLPRTGMFTPPSDNFDNLTDVELYDHDWKTRADEIVLRGNLIVDSLAITMPNDYAKLTFKPTVDVTIDTSKWVITGVVTQLDTLKIMEISNEYDYVDGSYYMPIRSSVVYYVKDARISRWLKKDLGSIMGADQSFEMQSDMVKGQINVVYDKYKVNRGLKSSIFK
ncbi:MAG: hypothetical protein VW833_00835 [Candidatus Neomarinimicrobiota bacterium]|jgi:hypothetical protein